LSDKNKGLYPKFYCQRIDGRDQEDGDREGASYFILDTTFDPHALPALKAYAESCQKEYPKLEKDLIKIIVEKEKSLEAQTHGPIACPECEEEFLPDELHTCVRCDRKFCTACISDDVCSQCKEAK
jgi:hypothetical protein